MRIHAMRAAVLTAGCAMVLALAANGCTQPSRSHSGDATDDSGGHDRPAVSAPGGRDAATGPGASAVFLARGECSTRNRQKVEEVPCRSERATATVITRHTGDPDEGPRCPARTDFTLHISERRPTADENGDGAVVHGYACMRNLQAPHPGDPGGGGGPRTVVGDCVFTTAREREVRETPCDPEPGRHAAEFKVVEQATDRTGCPPGTALFVDLGGSEPVGCAIRL